MANFKGFKQVSLSTYLATSEENRKDYLWFVREFSGETVIGSSIYFGNRKYADLTDQAEDPRVDNIIVSLGELVDENGEWVGFLPVDEHEILGNSGITSATDALSALEAAILANAASISDMQGAIEGKADASDVEALSGVVASNEAAISGLTANVEALSGAVEGIETAVEGKADASDVETLSGAVESVSSAVTAVQEKADDIEDALSALTSVVDEKANASDVYTKNEVYNKEEVDAKVVGAFKFKGEAESISADETTIVVNGEDVVASDANVGFVYQIGDTEYASNGEIWVKLGFNTDLSAYATKDYVNSAISEEAAAREALAEDVELVESALTKEIEERQALSQDVTELSEDVADLEERATITASTYTEASEIENLRLGVIVYVTNEEVVSGITYGSGAYINTQNGLRRLDTTTPSTSTTLEQRVETLENTVGSTAFSGDTLTNAVAELQAEHVVTGDDVEE